MANPLFEMMAGKRSMPGGPAPQMNMMDVMNQLRENPMQMIKNAGYNVPDEIAGNPQAMVMHLINTGQIGGPIMQRIQPMLKGLMR
jgi:hypothetical protein